MKLIKPGININFIGRRKMAFILSLVLVLAAFVLLIWRGGPNLGVDFSGGVLIQAKLDTAQTPDTIRESLEPIQLQDSIIQEFGEEKENEYLIRVRRTDIS